MKKLMTVLASAALAFGLYADDVVKDGTSFEVGEDGVSEGVFTPDGTTWAFEGEDPLEIGAYADGEVLPYDTPEKNVRWDEKFPQDTTNDNYLNLDTGTEKLTRTIGAGNLVVDQLVKFSGFDEVQTNFVDGTKIAVWMSDIEKEGEPNETNLYVTAGTTIGDADRIAIKIDGNDWELQKWYRLTIKSIGDIYKEEYTGDHRAGFVVYVDGDKVASDAAKAIIADDTFLNTAAGKLYAEGKLFPSIAKDTTFTSVAYAGTGAIDDIAADVKGPAFAIDTVDVTFKPVPNASIVSVIGVDGEITPDEKGVYAVTPGTDITVKWEAAADYFLKKDTAEYAITDAIEIDPADKDIEAEELVLQVTFDGDDPVPYSNIPDALAAVEAYTQTPGAEVEIVFIKDAEIPNAYAFAAGTSIEILDDFDSEEPPEFITSFWTISGGDVSFLVGIGNNKYVDFDCGEEDPLKTLTFAGAIGDGSTLKAAAITAAAGAIKLTPETAYVLSKDDELDAAFDVPAGYKLDKVADEEDADWTVYSLVEKQADYVVQIGDKQYETLAAALADAKDGDVLIFLKSVELDACVEIRKAITLSLAGCTISAPASGAFDVYSSLTVQDGDITTGKWGIWANPGASVSIAAGATLTCSGGPDNAAGIIADANTTVSVLGSVTLKNTDAAAVSGIGNDENAGAQITIGATAKIVSSGTGIYFPTKDGVLTISDFAEITAADNALEVKAGTVTIGAATIKSTKAIADATSAKNTDGTSAKGYALAITENKAYADNISITIDEGAKIAGKVGIVVDDEDAPAPKSIAIANGALFTDKDGAETLIDTETQQMAEEADEDGYYAVENIPPSPPAPTDVTITVCFDYDKICNVRINNSDLYYDEQELSLPEGTTSVDYALTAWEDDGIVFYQSTDGATPVWIAPNGKLPVTDGCTITFSAKDLDDPEISDEDMRSQLLYGGFWSSTLDKFAGPGEVKDFAAWTRRHSCPGDTINKSEFVQASVRLDVDLITDKTVVAFESVDLTDTSAATFKVKVGDSDVSAKKAVLSMVKAATEVGFGEGTVFEPKAEYDGTKKTVKVDISGKDAAFLKVVIPTDQVIERAD